MTLGLSAEERVARARGDLRIGAPVVVCSDAESAVIVATEALTDDRLCALRALGAPSLDLAVTNRRADTLRARAYDGSLARIILPEDANARWVSATADPSLDLAMPMKGPFKTRREGSADLHHLALTLTKQARLLPAAIVASWPDTATAREIAEAGNLTIIDETVLKSAADAALDMKPVSNAKVPTRFAEFGRCHVFRPGDGGEEHYAIEVGAPARSEPVLARLHSACFTGDVIGSLKCDCGPQLAAAMEQISEAGAGVLLYMNQEGRGIGLANKMRAYALQDQGYDTVEANHRLGFEDDERDFRLGAEIIKRMGFSSVRLMTNNPEKIRMMADSGVNVKERVELKVGRNPLNDAYLATKAAKSGHLL